MRGIHRWPVNYPHKWPVTRKMFPFDDVIMRTYYLSYEAFIINALYGRNIFEYICANTIFVCCWKCDRCLHIDVKGHWFNGLPRWLTKSSAKGWPFCMGSNVSLNAGKLYTWVNKQHELIGTNSGKCIYARKNFTNKTLTTLGCRCYIN